MSAVSDASLFLCLFVIHRVKHAEAFYKLKSRQIIEVVGRSLYVMEVAAIFCNSHGNMEVMTRS